LKLFELLIEIRFSFICLNAQLDGESAEQTGNEKATRQEDCMMIRKMDGDANNEQDGAARLQSLPESGMRCIHELTSAS
jgi:hypothetical protein